MTKEEKAKRFDEVVEEFRGLLECVHEDKCDIMEEDILKIVPELKKSEDERIRKEIINYFKCQSREEPSRKDTHNKWIAWLERQKPTTDIQNLTWEDIEKIGDFINIVQNENPNGIGAECLYTDVLERFLDGKQTKQKPIGWTEEDESKIKSICRLLKTRFDRDTCDEVGFTRDKMCDYLVGLKNKIQPQWKPSEEQIKVLEMIMDYVVSYKWSDYICNTLKNILEQLKKL